jgi:small subunit ribosomal protein S1
MSVDPVPESETSETTPPIDAASSAEPATTNEPAAAPEDAGVQPTATDGSDKSSAASEAPEAGKRVAIGSQRDAAAKPLQPKAVQAAVTNRIDLVEGEKAQPVDDGLGDVLSDAGLGDDIDAEIAAALGGLSMDSVVEGATTSEIEVEPGTRIKAVVSKIYKDDVFVKLDGQNEGIAAFHQFKEEPAEGDTVEVIVRGRNNEDGLYELSVPGAAVGGADWDELNEGDMVDAMVTGSNTGGLEVSVGSLSGFVPASQISRFRVDDFEAYLNQKLPCIVVEINPSKRKFVLSHRAVLEREQEEKKKKLLEELEVGQIREGIVTKLMDFGAFIDLGGMEGLAHISKLSWARIKHPSEVVKEGDKVKVKVEKYDTETGKMSLSYRDTLEDPWQSLGDQFSADDIVKGTVTRVADFGAFVKIAPAIEGLVHISELSYKRVARVSSVLNEGDEIEVKILTIDTQAQKVSLSLKATQAPPKPKSAGGKPEEPDVPARELVVPATGAPLKGGRERGSGGESIGLNL